MQGFFRYWLPVLVWLALIFVGSTDVMSAEQTSRFLLPFLRWLKPDFSLEALALIHFFMRKLGHLTEYAILAILLWRLTFRGMELKLRRPNLYGGVWILATLFAASDEYHQSFVPSRTAALGDVTIDSVGAMVGLAISFALAQRTSIRLEQKRLVERPVSGPERI